MPEQFESTSDDRTEKNVMRHQYRTLTDNEKIDMDAIKDFGEQFIRGLDTIASHTVGREYSRELSIARTKVEEAVMWACKHITK